MKMTDGEKKYLARLTQDGTVNRRRVSFTKEQAEKISAFETKMNDKYRVYVSRKKNKN